MMRSVDWGKVRFAASAIVGGVDAGRQHALKDRHRGYRGPYPRATSPKMCRKEARRQKWVVRGPGRRTQAYYYNQEGKKGTCNLQGKATSACEGIG